MRDVVSLLNGSDMTDGTKDAQTIEASEFTTVIPDDWKPFVKVLVAPLPRDFEPILAASQHTIDALNGKVRIRRPVHVLFAKAPFKINLGNGVLTYVPKKQEIINVHIEDLLIFLDCEKMIKLPMQLQVACILEEFVHTLMNVSDESLVSSIVALLYGEVRIVDGRYQIAAYFGKNKDTTD